MQLKQQSQIIKERRKMHQTKTAIISITDRAVEQIKVLLSNRGKPSAGIRVNVKQGGCSGLSYVIEYADTQNKYDEVVEMGDVKVLIEPKAIIYLIGTTMDFIDESIKSGFVFLNPNEKSKCGCGESFSV